jgi:thymidylate synthase (FAD)
MNELKVLDYGYVRLVTYTSWNAVDLDAAIRAGDLVEARRLIENHDLAEVNAARASFAKEKSTLDPGDERLVSFLADAEPVPHSSPFRHSHVTLEVQCPLIVARQWWRHVIGCGTTEDGTPWSELSRRYVRGGVQYHLPDRFRAAPANAKQGSSGFVDQRKNEQAQEAYKLACDLAVDVYDGLIAAGVAPEQARMVLPQAMYTSFRWSPSVQALANFLTQRLDEHAQDEIRVYAKAVQTLVTPIFPHALAALVG